MKRKILLLLMFSIAGVALSVTLFIGFYIHYSLENLLKKHEQNTLQQVHQKIVFFEEFVFRKIDNEMNLYAEKKTIEAYEKWKQKSNQDSAFLKKQAAELGLSGIYLADKNSIIFAASDPDSIGLELKKISLRVAKAIEKTFTTHQPVCQTIWTAATSGVKKKFCYYNPANTNLLFEISIDVKDFLTTRYGEEYYNKVFINYFKSIIQEDPFVKDIDLYYVSNIAIWSFLNDGKKITDSTIIKKMQNMEPLFHHNNIIYFLLKLNEKENPLFRNIYIMLEVDNTILEKFNYNFSLYSLLVSLLVCITVFTIFRKIFKKQFIDPVMVLNTTIKEIGNGNYKITVPEKIIAKKDEITEIALSIEKMKHQILEREKDLVLARENVEKANQIKTQFLSNVNHELRTPMTGILGMLQLLSRTPLTEEQKEYIEVIQIASDSLLRIIKNILDFSELKNNKTTFQEEAFSLPKLLNSLVEIYDKKIRYKNIDFEYSFQDIPEVISGFPYQIKQALIHILDNALKFTEKGKITFRVFPHEKGMLAFEVTDTGPGIDPKDYQTIFQGFNQVDYSDTRRYGGMGIGLAITKSIVEKMGGTIQLESEVGKGSTFTLYIPYKKIDFQKESNTDIKLPQKLHVLIAEDNQTNQEVIKKLIESKNWTYAIVENGREALSKMQEEKFDLILMDIQMPGMDGFETTRVIREKEKNTKEHIPIIAVTAFYMKGYEELCKLEGMDGYIEKPIKVEKLFYLIAQLFKNK